MQNLPQEGALVAKTFGISDRWPESGRIRFVDFRLRYGVDLPYVLDGVTFDVDANEKVGVVGRTGSGRYLRHCDPRFAVGETNQNAIGRI